MDFSEEGAVILDRSIWALPCIAEAEKVLGSRHYVYIIALLRGYRSPYRVPGQPDIETLKRILPDYERRHKDAKMNPDLFSHVSFVNATDSFAAWQYDPTWDEFITLEKKRVEFIDAIRKTPVLYDTTAAAPATASGPAASPRGRPASAKASVTEDNAKRLGDILSVQKAYDARYEELRARLFANQAMKKPPKAGDKSKSAMSAGDMRNHL